MTLTADAKKRVVLPGAAPGDVFVYEETGKGVLLKRIYRHREPRKQTKEQAVKAIKRWKSLRGVKWEELRKLTRQVEKSPRAPNGASDPLDHIVGIGSSNVRTGSSGHDSDLYGRKVV
jgi:hypothetical protein